MAFRTEGLWGGLAKQDNIGTWFTDGCRNDWSEVAEHGMALFDIALGHLSL